MKRSSRRPKCHSKAAKYSDELWSLEIFCFEDKTVWSVLALFEVKSSSGKFPFYLSGTGNAKYD